MLRDEYTIIFTKFELSLIQTYIQSLSIGFDEEISKDMKEHISQRSRTVDPDLSNLGIWSVDDILKQYSNNKESLNKEIMDAFLEFDTDRYFDLLENNQLFVLYSDYGIALSRLPKNFKEFQILGKGKMNFNQTIVMMIAYFESFLQDTLRTIIRVQPNLLKSRKKQMKWEEILKYSTMEGLINNLIEEYLYEFGWKTIVKRLEFLDQKMGLSIPNIDTRLFTFVENIRHIILHNNGYVNQRFLNMTGCKNHKTGDQIKISKKLLDEFYQQIRRHSFLIFEQVNRKFFDYKIRKEID